MKSEVKGPKTINLPKYNRPETDSTSKFLAFFFFLNSMEEVYL